MLSSFGFSTRFVRFLHFFSLQVEIIDFIPDLNVKNSFTRCRINISDSLEEILKA